MSELEQVAVSAEEHETDREQLIDQLMEKYGNDILHLVYTYVKNQTTAEDLTQEIFIKCYEKLDDFKQQSSMKTWLYRIAINHSKDYLRSWHYRKITLNDKIAEYIPSKSKQVEEEIIAKNEETTLTKAVMALPIKYREIVFLHYYEELTLLEISSTTTTNINTVKTRLKRAKELLKDMIKEEV
ncbi:RNA polymerase sigma-70 factor (ECF subfamily) [Evansella vedderi]|uniref:RNA polymerase sigma-70 factor (ECF subfamily) n=1 Tax=Evansella vedderi TaxID=38282 RepID=A0ABT9ZS97_9BACI|nr:sigma-70 family RNA polymerase sigma factor [Evansella vedderi]MDQ0253045.1 RNA polymerase sigma-70 factor (ECF subfamily) [Evansella vedderi]